jgi:hypothetical protein
VSIFRRKGYHGWPPHITTGSPRNLTTDTVSDIIKEDIKRLRAEVATLTDQAEAQRAFSAMLADAMTAVQTTIGIEGAWNFVRADERPAEFNRFMSWLLRWERWRERW